MLDQRILIKDTLNNIDKEVTLFGWVDSIRDHGKVGFIDLRDRTGIIQVVFYGKNYETIKSLGNEFVIKLTGKVQKRGEKQINEDIETGTVEIDLKEVEILNTCKEMIPIPVNSEGLDIKEEKRLKYRYLDLRRTRMQKIMRLRSDLYKNIREEFFKNDFVEIETPLLTKATKEGARDFLVPSLYDAGKFYALPQSPQQYKQLLMTAGFENYFQLAKCVRGEDLRADRGFEFTQLDIEMSFVDREDVLTKIEAMVKNIMNKMGVKMKDNIFPRIDYHDAVAKYGEDKFDLRNEQEKKDNVLAFAWVLNTPMYKKVDKEDAAEVEDGKNGWTFTHNPFSVPMPEHIGDQIKGKNLDKIISTQYDLVCNGYELGGGSIRAHTRELLESTFKNMGYSKEEIEKQVGHMLTAFELGTPPHGGIAFGLDRWVMILAGEKSLKETIAFPMTSTGKTAVMQGPDTIEESKLKEFNIKIIEKDE